jgi:hypothetical protein
MGHISATSLKRAHCLLVLCVSSAWSLASVADVSSDVRAFLATRWSDRIVIEESAPHEPIYVTVQSLPFAVAGAGCLYVAEYLTLERDGRELREAASSGGVPFAAEPQADGRCPTPAQGRYAELGVSIEDWRRIREVLGMLNNGDVDNRRFILAAASWPRGEHFELASAFYRQNDTAPQRPLISATLVTSSGTWSIHFETGCTERCALEMNRAETRE